MRERLPIADIICGAINPFFHEGREKTDRYLKIARLYEKSYTYCEAAEQYTLGGKRYYHTMQYHIEPGLRYMMEVFGNPPYMSRLTLPQREVLVAWTFHDSFLSLNTPKQGFNESKSADTATSFIAEWRDTQMLWSKQSKHNVGDLILSTCYSEQNQADNFEHEYKDLLQDVDLMFIGIKKPLFNLATFLIALEHGYTIDDRTYIRARAAALRNVVNVRNGKLFRMPIHDRFNEPVLQNIRDYEKFATTT